MVEAILVCNAGSSSLKFALFDAKDGLRLLFRGAVENIISAPTLTICDSNGLNVYTDSDLSPGQEQASGSLLKWILSCQNDFTLIAAGHRVVHGGQFYSTAVVINDDVMQQLDTLCPLAPLHQHYNLATILAFAKALPSLPQIACFDSAFHRSHRREEQLFALPYALGDEGILRYGFHGLSYEYINSVLPEFTGESAKGKVIVAHLGNGASMCAIKNRQSVACTLGFTALDGLMMGTRCGALDPGVILYLAETKGMSIDDIRRLLYNESGLLGVSGISHDMRNLLTSASPRAATAVSLFCYQAAKQLATLLPSLGGLDVLVFTAGIGQHSAKVREKICQHLSWLNLNLDYKKNTAEHSAPFFAIHGNNSAVKIFVATTDEEKIIAKHTYNHLNSSG